MTKGQSAIEYLMTYGWMLLVVAIVGGLIFTLAQDQDVEEVTGWAGQSILLEDFGITSEGNLSLQITNARRGTAEVKNVTVEDPSGRLRFRDSNFSEAEDDPDVLELGSQESAEVRLPNFSRNDTGQDFDVEIIFDNEGLTDQVSSGGFVGGIRMDE
ncbi:MAG: hypothetical protein R6V35_02820 [Candidatus Nanohaloarchaea archaeon]